MAATIPADIFGLRGQCVKSVAWDDEAQTLLFHCDRDRRFAPVARSRSGHPGLEVEEFFQPLGVIFELATPAGTGFASVGLCGDAGHRVLPA